MSEATGERLSSGGRSPVDTATVHRALADYRHRCEIAPLKHYPAVWGAHYNGPLALGQFGVPEIPKGELAPVCGAVMIPFAISGEVEVSYVVVDSLMVSDADLYFEANHVLYVSSLRATERGIATTHWTVSLREIRDFGVRYGEPVKAPPLIPGLPAVLSELVDRRMLGVNASYEDAYQACLIVFKEMFA